MISRELALGEAASSFLAKLTPEGRAASQPEVNRFVRWFGRERPLAGLTAREVANYAEQLSLSNTDYDRKLELLRAFLVRAKKEGWSPTNFAVHLKPKKVKNSRAVSVPGLPESVALTRPGHAALNAGLANLKSERLQVTEDIRRAAADKDFRENAPYHAARERKGHIEGRIREIEETLKFAVIIDQEQKASLKAVIGGSVILCDLTSGKELNCMIVHPKEVDPTRGKISSASPIGRAVLGRGEGEVVEVMVPAGKLRYQIKQVKR